MGTCSYCIGGKAVDYKKHKGAHLADKEGLPSYGGMRYKGMGE